MFRFIKPSRCSLKLCEILLGGVVVNSSKTCHKNFASTLASLKFNNNFRSFSTTQSEIESEESDEPNIKEIVGDDAELEHKLRVLILEAEVMRQEGKPVPINSSMKSHHWKTLLQRPTKSARRKYLEFLFKIEKKKENLQKKKELKRLEREANPRPERDPDGPTSYELGHNNFFLRFYDTTINHMYNNRLVQAMQFGQKLIVDCGYHENMNSRENLYCAKQLTFLFSENRSHDDPFDLYLCNANRDSELMLSLHKFINTIYEPWFPLNVHEVSYLDLFPKEKLVYLTPHCRETLTKYDHDAVYIIGGIVDKVNNEPLSMAKAKREGIKMAKLPLDHYLDWGSGSGKSLTVNQVGCILLDIKHTGDWNHALRHVPRRKLMVNRLATEKRKLEKKLGQQFSYSVQQKMQNVDFTKSDRSSQQRKRIADIKNIIQ